MPPNLPSLEIDKVKISYTEEKFIRDVQVDASPLKLIVGRIINNTRIITEPFKPDNSKIEFPQEIEDVSRLICETALKIRLDSNDPCLAAYFASHYFEQFIMLWSVLLSEGKNVLACRVWIELLAKVLEWEVAKKQQIHKGTPYFFLAERYILVGNLEMGSNYASKAIEEDERLGVQCPSLRYPTEAPIYKTLSLKNDPANHMYYLVLKIRGVLQGHLDRYNTEYKTSMKMADIDTKFLQNTDPNIDSVKQFFVFVLWSIVDVQKEKTLPSLKNDFAKLKNLNTIFDFCLIIDKMLEFSSTIGEHDISHNIVKINNIKKWMQQDQLENLQRSLGIADSSVNPDLVLPKLLFGNMAYNSKQVPKQVLDFLILWKLRNYGGHNIKQQNILVDRFEDIIAALMNCLFMAVDVMTGPILMK